MNTGYVLNIITGNLTPVAFYLTWWFHLLIMLVVIGWGYFYHRSKTGALNHEMAELESQLHQRSELLTYSKRNEQIAREDAQNANTNKSLLLSQISHDIRTPMTNVMGMASLLTETELNAEQQEYATTILQSGESLLGLINDILMKDILEYSKVETGKELDFKEFDIRNSIEEVLDVFAAKAALSGLDLIYDIESKIPAQIVGDNQRLRQILMNLVENSLKFTHHGEIFIEVQFIEAVGDSHIKLEFEVRDTGVGISAVNVRQLSKELMQSAQTLQANGVAGVGLIICKNLLALMGGTISVDSIENEGTSFRFTMSVRTNVQPLRAPISAEIERKKILIVDDNATVRTVLKKQLDQWKLAVTIADSGAHALSLLEANSGFDLVLTDYQMPEMDGITLAETLKRLYPQMPIILLNKIGDETFRKQPELFSAVVNKPVRQHVLSEQMFSLLRQGGKVVSINDNKQKLSVDFAKQYPLTILIAEDNLMNQKIVTKVLTKLGYEPHVTNNGKEVLEEVSNTFYDLILMDVQMPEMDGLEATKMIRVCLSTQPVIIAMTANTLQGDREECLRAGMDDYISKPVKLEEMVNILEKWALQVQQKAM